MSDTVKMNFEEWAGPKGFCLDRIFMSSEGVPSNPYVDGDTLLAFDIWKAALAAGSSVTLSAKELRDALDFANPDGPEASEQLETKVTILWREAFTSSDNDAFPAGNYAYLAESPDEGLYGPLGVDLITQQSV